YMLENNYPNPFNPTTTIGYALPRAGQTTLIIYNLLGQKVRTLINSNHEAGKFQITWNGLDDNGRSVGSGVYLYRLKSGNFAQVKRMLLLK
ncbi:MAG: T9SS type A sorting domain-containing protein, partial [Calditrichia bacterium]